MQAQVPADALEGAAAPASYPLYAAEQDSWAIDEDASNIVTQQPSYLKEAVSDAESIPEEEAITTGESMVLAHAPVANLNYSETAGPFSLPIRKTPFIVPKPNKFALDSRQD